MGWQTETAAGAGPVGGEVFGDEGLRTEDGAVGEGAQPAVQDLWKGEVAVAALDGPGGGRGEFAGVLPRGRAVAVEQLPVGGGDRFPLAF